MPPHKGLHIVAKKPLFYFCTTIDRMKTWTKGKVADLVEKEILKYWTRANIAVQNGFWIKKKIMMIVKRYEILTKNLKRNSETEARKRAQFLTDLKSLFDVASPDAEDKLKRDRLLGDEEAEDDLKFLEDQRGKRKMVMGGLDNKYGKKLDDKGDRSDKKKNYRNKKKKEQENNFKVVQNDSGKENESSTGEDEDDDWCPNTEVPKKKRIFKSKNKTVKQTSSWSDFTHFETWCS